MSRPYIKSIQPYDAKEVFGKLSQSNHYQVSFTALNRPIVDHLSRKFGISRADDYMSRRGGILCSEASLPATSLATAEVKDNFMGIPQEFAHTRLYTDIDFTFYVDKEYKNLRILEGWIDYISSGSDNEIDELSDNYYRRMRYPETYKVQSMFISKFEKDYKQQLDYQFINAFPVNIVAIPVSYGSADILKVTVSFNYDRYIINPKGRIRQNPASDPLRRADSAELESAERNKNESLTNSPQPIPIQVDPYTQPIQQPVQTTFGNTYGTGSDFVERDSATGVRMDGILEPEPITYRQELGLDPL